MDLPSAARELWQDLRLGARLLIGSPGFTLASVACLTIGIGVTTTMLSSLRATVFRALPEVGAPGGLVRMQTPMPYGNYEEFRDHSGQFASLAAFMGPVPFVITADGGARERLWGQLVTPDYFDVLRVVPELGRLFGPAERARGAAQVAVISDRLWRRRFGSDASVIGRTIRLNGQPVTLVGVTPGQFRGASPLLAAADVWAPTTASPALAPELQRLDDRRVAGFVLIGRLRPGIGTEEAEAALETQARRLEQIHNDPGKDRKERRAQLLPGGRLFPIRDQELPAAMGLPVVLAGLVLLMGCGNVANMLIARGTARRREIGIRLAIGAGRGRLVRQLLAESLLLGGLGCAGGIWMTSLAIGFYSSLMPMFPGYVFYDWKLDWNALFVAAAAGLIASVLAGLAPALQATGGGIVSAMKPEAPPRLRARRWFSLRNIVVTQQVAASIVLLLLTGFIVLGYRGASGVDLGFSTKDLYLMNVDPVRDGYDAAQAAGYLDKLPDWVARVPGVTAVSLAETVPVAFTPGEAMMSAKAEIAGGPKTLSSIRSDRVGAGFFRTVGIPIVSGRSFRPGDMNDAARVMLVNETMAEQVWPGQNAVGRSIEFENETYEVIGVAGDIRPALPLAPPLPAIYQPAAPSTLAAPSPQGVTLLVRVQPGFDAAARLRREAEAFDPNVTVFNVRRIEDLIGESLFLVNTVTGVYGSVGLFALVLAAVGLSGVTSYAVARRTREIAIRIALGANRSDVLGLIMREAVILILCGTAIGMAVALAAMRVMSSILNAIAEGTRTSISNPVLLVGVPALLAGLTLLACYLPARRAAGIDPMGSLKAE